MNRLKDAVLSARRLLDLKGEYDIAVLQRKSFESKWKTVKEANPDIAHQALGSMLSVMAIFNHTGVILSEPRRHVIPHDLTVPGVTPQDILDLFDRQIARIRREIRDLGFDDSELDEEPGK